MHTRATALWFTPDAERLCDGLQALLLSGCSLPCTQLHIFLKFKDQFYITNLESTTNSLLLLSRSVHVCLWHNFKHFRVCVCSISLALQYKTLTITTYMNKIKIVIWGILISKKQKSSSVHIYFLAGEPGSGRQFCIRLKEFTHTSNHKRSPLKKGLWPKHHNNILKVCYICRNSFDYCSILFWRLTRFSHFFLEWLPVQVQVFGKTEITWNKKKLGPLFQWGDNIPSGRWGFGQ